MSKYQFSLASLLDQTREDVASEAAVAKAKALLETPQPLEGQTDEAEGEGGGEGSPTSKGHGARAQEDLLVSLAEEEAGPGDSVAVQRIKHAAARTEALRQSKEWHFFQPSSPVDDQADRPPFPDWSCPSDSDGWQAMLKGEKEGSMWPGRRPARASLTLKDAVLRQQAFVTGYAAEMTRVREALPDEVIRWVLQESRYTSSVAAGKEPVAEPLSV